MISKVYVNIDDENLSVEVKAVWPALGRTTITGIWGILLCQKGRRAGQSSGRFCSY